MWLFRKSKESVDAFEAAAQRLLEQFDALDAESASLAEEKLFLLYRWLTERFGSVGRFLSGPETEQDAYLEKLDTAAARAAEKGSAYDAYYVSASMLSIYLRAFRRPDVGPATSTLAGRVVDIIDRARRTAE